MGCGSRRPRRRCRRSDALGYVFPTPKVIDLVWRQATTRFDAVVNIKGRIVANCSISLYNKEVQYQAEKAGLASEGPIACVGKYWVICNSLDRKGLKYGKKTAANYGWHSSRAPKTRPGVTGGDVRVWQTLGTSHNDLHVDPSQVVRLVDPLCFLTPRGGEQREVTFQQIAQDQDLHGLVNHDGPLRVLRQPSVPKVYAKVDDAGVVHMPETTIIGQVSNGEDNGRQEE